MGSRTKKNLSIAALAGFLGAGAMPAAAQERNMPSPPPKKLAAETSDCARADAQTKDDFHTIAAVCAVFTDKPFPDDAKILRQNRGLAQDAFKAIAGRHTLAELMGGQDVVKDVLARSREIFAEQADLPRILIVFDEKNMQDEFKADFSKRVNSAANAALAHGVRKLGVVCKPAVILSPEKTGLPAVQPPGVTRI